MDMDAAGFRDEVDLDADFDDSELEAAQPRRGRFGSRAGHANHTDDEDDDEDGGQHAAPPTTVDQVASWLSDESGVLGYGQHGVLFDIEEARDHLIVAATSERLGMGGLAITSALGPAVADGGGSSGGQQTVTAGSAGGGIIGQAEEALARVGSSPILYVNKQMLRHARGQGPRPQM